MEQTIAHDDPTPSDVKSWQLWFSLVAGIVIWILHLTIVYSLTSLTCEWGWFPFMVGDLSGLQVVQIVITIVAISIPAAAGFFAFQNRQRLNGSQRPEENRHHFMAHLGFTLNILFIGLIAFTLVPMITLPPCA